MRSILSFSALPLLMMATGLVPSTTTAADKTVVVIGDDDYSPYIYADNGQAKGIYAEILEKASDKIEGYNIEIKLLPWKRGLAFIEQGKEFGIVPPYYRPELRPWMAPYSEAIFPETIVVVCNSDAATKLQGADFPSGYAGTTFGNNSGFKAGGAAFHAMVEQGQIKMKEAKTTASNLKKVTAGRVDCYINDKLAIKSTIKQEGLDGSKVVETATITAEQAYLGYSKAGWENYDYADDFSAKFNKVIKTMKESGEIDALIEKNLGQ